MTIDDLLMEKVRAAVREEIREALREVRREPAPPVPLAEAARRLGVSKRTVQRRIEDGSLVAVRPGGKGRPLVLLGPPQEVEDSAGVAEIAHLARRG